LNKHTVRLWYTAWLTLQPLQFETTLEINVLTVAVRETWCPGADLNHRHADFQSTALPTELPGHIQLTNYDKNMVFFCQYKSSG
jgi:hypothetical protein